MLATNTAHRFKRTCAAVFLLAAGPAFSQERVNPADPLILAVKPLFDVWRTCAMSKSSQYVRSGETAEIIAQTALAACDEEKRRVGGALMTESKTNAHRALEDLAFLEKSIHQQIMISILEAKSAR
jgi:hypothetical protein